MTYNALKYMIVARSVRRAGYLVTSATLCSLLITSWGCSGGGSGSSTSLEQNSNIPVSENSLTAIDAGLNRNIAIGITRARGALDFFGPPPVGDPSAFTGPFIGLEFARDFLATLPPQNEGAFEGGLTGTPVDAGVNNAAAEDEQRPGGNFNAPTNGRPSPLFGARSFTQKMLLFEEFGPEPVNADAPPPALSFPAPVDAQSGPLPGTLGTFLAQGAISPFPTQ